MNIALRQPPAPPMTLQEFLAWEERQELRYEFDGVKPVAMNGGTAAHAAIQRNLLVALAVRLRGTPCSAYGGDLKIQVAGRIRYPDAFVVCTPVSPRATVVTDPVVVFEVMSESSIGTDLIYKCAEYRATPSIRRYVVLEQGSVAAMPFSRKGDDWVTDQILGREALLPLPELGIELPMAELYADLELESEAPREPAGG